MPTTARQSTLSAISQKTHTLTAQIVHVKAQGHKMQAVFSDAETDAASRLDMAHALVNKL